MEDKRKIYKTTPIVNVEVTASHLSSRQKAYSKTIRGLMMVAAGIYELIFDETAPRPTDALRG